MGYGGSISLSLLVSMFRLPYILFKIIHSSWIFNYLFFFIIYSFTYLIFFMFFLYKNYFIFKIIFIWFALPRLKLKMTTLLQFPLILIQFNYSLYKILYSIKFYESTPCTHIYIHSGRVNFVRFSFLFFKLR